MSRLLIVVIDHWGDEALLRSCRFSPSILVAKGLRRSFGEATQWEFLVCYFSCGVCFSEHMNYLYGLYSRPVYQTDMDAWNWLFRRQQYGIHSSSADNEYGVGNHA